MDSPSKKRAEPSLGSSKQQLWVSCAGRAVAKLHLALDLGVLSQEVVWGLLPRAPQVPLARLGGSTEACWAALPTLQAPT